MTPLQLHEAEIRSIVEWAYLTVQGIDSYKRNVMSISEET